MKKSYIIIAVIGVVAIAAIAALLLSNANKTNQQQTNNTNGQNFVTLDACELFTEGEAKEILGADASTGTNTPPASTDDLAVSNCTYSNNATKVSDIRSISILVRSPRTQAGVDSNKQAFGAGTPVGAQAVSGYGSEAYFASGQLNILKDNNWIIITFGGTNPSNNSLDDAKKVADKIVN